MGRIRAGLAVALGIVAIPIIVASCQREASQEGVVATSTQAVVSDNFALTYAFPINWSADKSVVIGRESVEVADHAKVSGAGAVVACLGTGTFRVGAEAQVANLWAAGGVSLSDGSAVNGSVESGVAASLGNNVTIAGPITVRSGAAQFATKTIALEFKACSNDVMLEPNTERPLSTGAWGDVLVKQGATLHLASGEYKFRSLFVEPGGSVVVHSDGTAAKLIVQNSVTIRGTFSYPETEAPLTVLAAGNEVTIDAALKATVIAPNARVAVNSSASTFTGSLYGRDIYLAPGVTVNHYVPATGVPTVIRAPLPELTDAKMGTTAGAPPNLADSSSSPAARAADFVTWVQRATESDLPAGRDEIAKIRTNDAMKSALVAETWATISSKRLSRALVALETLAELDTAESEAVFNTLVWQPPPGTGTWSEEFGQTNDDHLLELLQGKAAQGLGWRRTPSAKATLKSLATTHPSQFVRAQAIRMYVLYYGDIGRAELAPLLNEHDVGRLDTFETLNVDGRSYKAKEDEYRAKHPEVEMEEPSEVTDVSGVCAAESEED